MRQRTLPGGLRQKTLQRVLKRICRPFRPTGRTDAVAAGGVTQLLFERYKSVGGESGESGESDKKSSRGIWGNLTGESGSLHGESEGESGESGKNASRGI